MSEGIIDLHHILFYLYKCPEQTVVMVARGSMWWQQIITCPEEALWLALRDRGFRRANWCGRPRGWLSWAGDFEGTDVFCDVKIYCDCIVYIVKWPLWCLQIEMIEDRTCVKINMWCQYVGHDCMWLVKWRDWYSGVRAIGPEYGRWFRFRLINSVYYECKLRGLSAFSGEYKFPPTLCRWCRGGCSLLYE